MIPTRYVMGSKLDVIFLNQKDKVYRGAVWLAGKMYGPGSQYVLTHYWQHGEG